MQEMLEQFQAYLLTEKRVSTNTCSAYMRDVHQLYQFLAKQGLPTVVAEVTTEHLKSFLVFLKDQHVTARSMARKICAMRSFFTYAAEYHHCSNSAEDLIAPKLEQKLPTFLQEEEVSQLLHAADEDATPWGLRNKTMLYLLYVTGMRISELLAVCVADVHFDSGFVVVRGKGGNERLVPLPQEMLALLGYYVQQRPEEYRQHEFLFVTQYKKTFKPMTRQAFWVILKKLWHKTGNTKPIWPHQLRHSLATHLLKNGADLRSLQMLLGHENIATVQIYTHVETKYIRTIYDKKHPRA